jgi:hypothetical protein
MRGILPDGIIDRPKKGFRRAAGPLVPRGAGRLRARRPPFRRLPGTWPLRYQACRAADRAAPEWTGPRSPAVDASVIRALVPSRARRSDPSPSTGRTRGARADPARRDGLDNCPREKTDEPTKAARGRCRGQPRHPGRSRRAGAQPGRRPAR